MRSLLPGTASLLILSAAAIGCGDDGSGPTPTAVLTTVEVTPATTTLFSLAPENTVQLSVVGKDQNGQTINTIGVAFTSDAEGVATVDELGLVTAVAAGTARITVSATASGVTKAGTADVTVQVAPATAAVTTPGIFFQPQTVDVAAGGTVTWTIGDLHHTVTFTTSGAPDGIPETTNQSVGRGFPASGSFAYFCEIHPQMTGTVRVH